jgi:hypothetical protein
MFPKMIHNLRLYSYTVDVETSIIVSAEPGLLSAHRQLAKPKICEWKIEWNTSLHYDVSKTALKITGLVTLSNYYAYWSIIASFTRKMGWPVQTLVQQINLKQHLIWWQYETEN